MSLQSTRIELDKITSLVPLVSTLTNGINLLQKLFILPNMSMRDVEKNYYSYLKNKSSIEISLEMIPVIGNIYALYQRIIWNNPNFVLQQIKKDSSNLLKASIYLQNNPTFLIRAFDHNKTTLHLVSKEIKEHSKEFCLGVISVCTRKREELEKKLEDFLIKNEIYLDCKDIEEENEVYYDCEDSFYKESTKKKQIPLELFYAHITKADFNRTFNLLEDIFEKNTQAQRDLPEQASKLQEQDIKVKTILDHFSASNELYKQMEYMNKLYEIPGYILKGTNALLDQGLKGLQFLVSKKLTNKIIELNKKRSSSFFMFCSNNGGSFPIKLVSFSVRKC